MASAISGVTLCSVGAEPRPLRRLAGGRRADHGTHQVGRDGEADAGGAARRRDDHAVDADQLAVHVDQRAAGIARIDRGVGLDEILVLRLVAGHMGEGRDDAAGHRLADAEGVADGQHQVADLDLIGIGEARCVGRFVPAPVIFSTARSERWSLSTISAGNSRLSDSATLTSSACSMTWKLVTIRPDGIDDDAGAERPLDALARLTAAEIAEEAAEERIGEERRGLLLDHARGVDVDHRRRDLLDHRGEGKLHRGCVGAEPAARRRARPHQRPASATVNPTAIHRSIVPAFASSLEPPV